MHYVRPVCVHQGFLSVKHLICSFIGMAALIGYAVPSQALHTSAVI